MFSYRRETALQDALVLAKSGRLEWETMVIQTSMTLNDLEWRNSHYLVFFFTGFDSFAGPLCHSG